MKKIVRKLFTHNRPVPLIKPKFNNLHFTHSISTFGKKNKKKVFYVINRPKGSGFFSNFFFVLNHIKYSLDMGFHPIVDMKNFSTIYNEVSGKYKNLNLWDIFFHNTSKVKLHDVYKSNNVIFSSNKFPENTFFSDWNKRNLKKISDKYIKIKNEFQTKKKMYIKQNFKGKILGVHFRGTSYKTARNHSLQPNEKIMIELINNLLSKYKYKKIFLITEERKYLDSLKKNFGDKLIFYKNSYRSYKDDAFKVYPRKNHRYFLAEDTFVETLILSCCDGIISNTTNVEKAARFFSKKKQKIHKIFLGFNSNNKYVARYKWYLKSFLHQSIGGLKIISTKNI